MIAWLLGGPTAEYAVPLPGPGEPKRGILDTYTKEHSAEYQSRAPIDLAFRLRERIGDLDQIASIVLHTSHHTHYVIGTGSNDPQKFDPKASRETLDHSITYIFAGALQDGGWHHERSYAPERAQRPDTIALWNKIATAEDPEWTRRYHADRRGLQGVRAGRLRAARVPAARASHSGGRQSRPHRSLRTRRALMIDDLGAPTGSDRSRYGLGCGTLTSQSLTLGFAPI